MPPLLSRALESRRLAHAYLFRGPAGVGKRASALALASALNCEQAGGPAGCGHCASCRTMASGNHPDLLLIEPEGATIRIDQIRQLKKALVFPPFQARFRLVVLDKAHTLRREAANSLLKVLEEPPADTILILVADEARQMLPTILSRCQVIPFHPPPLTEAARVLTTELALTPAEAAALAAVAEGSLGRARLLHEQGIFSLRTELIRALSTLPADSAETVTTVFRLAEAAAGLKEDLAELFDLLETWLRDLLLLREGCRLSILNQDLQPLLAESAGHCSRRSLRDKLALLARARRQLARNVSRALVCEALFFGLLAPPQACRNPAARAGEPGGSSGHGRGRRPAPEAD